MPSTTGAVLVTAISTIPRPRNPPQAADVGIDDVVAKRSRRHMCCQQLVPPWMFVRRPGRCLFSPLGSAGTACPFAAGRPDKRRHAMCPRIEQQAFLCRRGVGGGNRPTPVRHAHWPEVGIAFRKCCPSSAAICALKSTAFAAVRHTVSQACACRPTSSYILPLFSLYCVCARPAGTCNNQYMVVDLKRFRPRQARVAPPCLRCAVPT